MYVSCDLIIFIRLLLPVIWCRLFGSKVCIDLAKFSGSATLFHTFINFGFTIFLSGVNIWWCFASIHPSLKLRHFLLQSRDATVIRVHDVFFYHKNLNVINAGVSKLTLYYSMRSSCEHMKNSQRLFRLEHVVRWTFAFKSADRSVFFSCLNRTPQTGV